MLSEKSRENIRGFLEKVTSVEGGTSFLSDLLSGQETVRNLIVSKAEFLSAFIERAIRSTESYSSLKSAMKDKGLVLLKDVSLLKIPDFDGERLKNALVGVAIDTETDGRDVQSVIDLGMVRFFYDAQGIICIDGEPFSKFRDSGTEIDPGAQMVHGITNEDIAGAVITDEEVLEYCQGVSMFVAHNADFDRKILERDFPNCGFDTTSWGCSLSEIDWGKYGIADRKLELICLRQGFTYPSHRAAPDSLAVIHAMQQSDGRGGAFLDLMTSMSRVKVMICLERVPFDAPTLMKNTGMTPQDFLKKTGFRYSQADGLAGLKCWYKIYDTKKGLIEDSQNIRDVYEGAHVELPIRVLDSMTLYSDRLPDLTKAGFRTSVPHLTLGFDLLHGDPSEVFVPELPSTEEDMLAQF